MTEAVQTSETLVNSCQSTRRYNWEDSHLQVKEVCCNIHNILIAPVRKIWMPYSGMCCQFVNKGLAPASCIFKHKMTHTYGTGKPWFVQYSVAIKWVGPFHTLDFGSRDRQGVSVSDVSWVHLYFDIGVSPVSLDFSVQITKGSDNWPKVNKGIVQASPSPLQHTSRHTQRKNYDTIISL
jgi:hypothetical protein